MKSLYTTTLLIAGLSATQAEPVLSCCPSGTDRPRPDAYAPISIMGDHTHHEGGWMLSYRFMRMEMDGMANGTSSESTQDIFDANYAVAPEEMTMDMHMFGLMFAPTDRFTFMVMANYLDIEMDHAVNPAVAAMINNGEDGFTTESSGWGDLKFTGLYQFYQKERQRAHVGLGISVPTGSIDKQDETPAMSGRQRQQLPAPMQLGSGTFDLLPSITWVELFDDWSYGAQANATIRLESENDNGYQLGDAFEVVGWAAYNLTDWIAINGGLSYEWSDELDGEQDGIGTMAPGGRQSVTTAFGDNYGGERVDAILGVNLLGNSGMVKGHRLALDVRLPLWQDLNGYQLETDYVVTLGWQTAW